MGCDPVRQRPGQGDVLANVVPDPLRTVRPEDEPEFQRAEPPAERHVPVPVVDDPSGRRCLVAEIRGQDAQRFDQRGTVGDVEERTVEVREHPLVRVERVRIDEFETVLEVSELVADHRRPRIGGVHVMPDPVGSCDLPDLPDGVDGRRRGRSDGRHDGDGDQPRGDVGLDRSFERVGSHRVPAVDGNEAHVAVAGHTGTLLDRRMGLLGRIDDHVLGAPARTLSRDDERRVRRVRRTHLDDAAARAFRLPTGGEAEQIDRPVGDDLLDLGCRRARRPQHALDAEPRRDQFAEDGRGRGVRGEVAEPPGGLPVGDARHHDVVEIPQHRAERFRLLGRLRRDHLPDGAGLDRRRDRPIRHGVEVVGDPVDHLVPVSTEVVRRHVIRDIVLRPGPFESLVSHTPTSMIVPVLRLVACSLWLISDAPGAPAP